MYVDYRRGMFYKQQHKYLLSLKQLKITGTSFLIITDQISAAGKLSMRCKVSCKNPSNLNPTETEVGSSWLTTDSHMTHVCHSRVKGYEKTYFPVKIF